ncbi:MAG: acyl-CoA dehydrogenase, partial [Psychrobacter sp.]|nr:acyl-CoA dehydrogenase [Psychrobacter sp.]
MPLKNTQNPLLQAIKSAINDILVADNQSISDFVMTDSLRHDILKILMAFSPDIPHPASGLVKTDSSINENTAKATLTNAASANLKTLIRWQILAYVASIDLTLVKWFESHLDSLSILNEVGYKIDSDKSGQALWAVWASEGHPSPIRYEQEQGETSTVSGTKAWCSGANIVDYGLMT